jgi:hypothetical protein
MPPFLLRLEFYGSAVGILGLVILLSYDVPYLQPQLLRLPALRRRRQLLLRLKEKHASLDTEVTTMYVPKQALIVRGSDAANFLALYPDWPRRRVAPSSISIFVVHGNPLQAQEPWIYPSDDGGVPLTTAMVLSTLFMQEERAIQKSVYSIGFLLMLFGELLILVHTMAG